MVLPILDLKNALYSDDQISIVRFDFDNPAIDMLVSYLYNRILYEESASFSFCDDGSIITDEVRNYIIKSLTGPLLHDESTRLVNVARIADADCVKYSFGTLETNNNFILKFGLLHSRQMFISNFPLSLVANYKAIFKLLSTPILSSLPQFKTKSSQLILAFPSYFKDGDLAYIHSLFSHNATWLYTSEISFVLDQCLNYMREKQYI